MHGCIRQIVGDGYTVVSWHILDRTEQVVAPGKQWVVGSRCRSRTRQLSLCCRPLLQATINESSLAEVILVMVLRHPPNLDWELPSHELLNLPTLAFYEL